MFYMVFGSSKRPYGFSGAMYLDWSEGPIGVYQADSPEDACKAAANDKGALATFFAIEGYPWGISMLQSSARQLGRTQSPAEERMERILGVLEQRATAGELDAGEPGDEA